MDSFRVFEYDTTKHAEYVVFDCPANPGDTVSIRDSGSRITIALGSLSFAVGNFINAIRDSLGVVSVTHSPCYLQLVYAFIDGRRAYPADVKLADPALPRQVVLSQNFPNPFNPVTTILFNIPARSHVSLKVFAMLGREITTILNEELPAGVYARQWHPGSASSGVNFFRLQAGIRSQTQKLLLVR